MSKCCGKIKHKYVEISNLEDLKRTVSVEWCGCKPDENLHFNENGQKRTEVNVDTLSKNFAIKMSRVTRGS